MELLGNKPDCIAINALVFLLGSNMCNTILVLFTPRCPFAHI